ncbi:MAG: (Fe-S)-binding protein, partial [Bacillota bacterium]
LLKRLYAQSRVGQTLASGMGVGWARAGGENHAVGPASYLAVDGIHSVTDVLEEIERGKLKEIDFIECLACVGGCVGGALTVENPFVARVKIRQLSEKLGMTPSITQGEVERLEQAGFFKIHGELEPRPALKLDDNVAKAISKMEQLERQAAQLPGLDCGACGSPTCRALAEDIVQGESSELDCVIKLKEKVQSLAQEMLDLARKIPTAMSDDVGASAPKPEGKPRAKS